MSQEAELAEFMQRVAAEFDQLCQKRHEEGAKEYGHLTFLENDVIRMMVEELADTVNYCRYQAIKLMLLQTMLEDRLSEAGVLTQEEKDAGEVTIGIQSFKGAGRGWDEQRK